MTCKAAGCERPARRADHGLCDACYVRRRRRELLARGICGICASAPRQHPSTLCKDCHRRQNAATARYQKRRAQERIAQRLCPDCGEPAGPVVGQRCLGCANAKNASSKRRKDARKDAGLCVDCTAPHDGSRGSRCATCADDEAARMREKRASPAVSKTRQRAVSQVTRPRAAEVRLAEQAQVSASGFG